MSSLMWKCLIFFYLFLYADCLRRFYMEEDCDGTIALTSLRIPAGRLSVSRRSTYRKTLDCHMRIEAPDGHRLVIVFTELDVEWEPRCDDDFAQLFDGTSMKSPVVNGLPPRICGHKVPRGNFATTQNVLTVYFRSDIYKEDDGFEIVFTSFHKGPFCDKDELRCDNGRCVAASLKCNDFDNCGDNSDECDVDASTLVGIVSSVFLISVLAIGSALFCRNRRRTRRQRERKASMAKLAVVAPIVKGVPNIAPPCPLCLEQQAPPTSGEDGASVTKNTTHVQGEENYGMCLADEIVLNSEHGHV